MPGLQGLSGLIQQTGAQAPSGPGYSSWGQAVNAVTGNTATPAPPQNTGQSSGGINAVARAVQQQSSGGSGGNSGGGAPAPSGPSGGGEISQSLEALKLGYAQQAAYQAYLNAKLNLDTEELALKKAQQAADEAYRQKTFELEGRKLVASGTATALQMAGDRAQAYNTGMAQFENSGVATGGRLAGLNALRQPLPRSVYASLVGLAENDPRVDTIAQAANQLTGAGGSASGLATGTAGASYASAPVAPSLPPPPQIATPPILRLVMGAIPSYATAA